MKINIELKVILNLYKSFLSYHIRIADSKYVPSNIIEFDKAAVSGSFFRFTKMRKGNLKNSNKIIIINGISL